MCTAFLKTPAALFLSACVDLTNKKPSRWTSMSSEPRKCLLGQGLWLQLPAAYAVCCCGLLRAWLCKYEGKLWYRAAQYKRGKSKNFQLRFGLVIKLQLFWCSWMCVCAMFSRDWKGCGGLFPVSKQSQSISQWFIYFHKNTFFGTCWCMRFQAAPKRDLSRHSLTDAEWIYYGEILLLLPERICNCDTFSIKAIRSAS